MLDFKNKINILSYKQNEGVIYKVSTDQSKMKDHKINKEIHLIIQLIFMINFNQVKLIGPFKMKKQKTKNIYKDAKNQIFQTCFHQSVIV